MSTEATLGSSTTKKRSFDEAFKLKVVDRAQNEFLIENTD